MIQQFSSPEDLSKGQTAFLLLPINSTEPSHLTFPQTAENHPAHDSSENSPLNPSNNSDHDSDVPKSRSHSTLHSFIVYVFALVTILLVFTIFIVMYFHLHTKNSHLHSNYDLKKPLITFLQLNDLYEILPQQKQGGFEYISTLKRKLEGKYVNCIFAGDLISPSPISTVNYEGSKLNGRQMIDLANDVFDIATLGNHEFDYDAETFRMRILESKFPWIRSNIEPEGVFVELDTKHVTKSYEIRSFSISDGDVTSTFKELRIAFLGISPAYLKVPYAKVNNIRDTIKLLPNIISEIREKHSPHMIIAITHLNFEDDVELASADLGIDLIMGGHEHENMLAVRGQTDVVITKADSDARSAYIHKVYLFEPDISEDILRSAFPFTSTVLRRDDITIVVDRYLQKITTDTSGDSAMHSKVEHWWNIAVEAFEREGFNIGELVYKNPSIMNLTRKNIYHYVDSSEGKLFATSALWCGKQYISTEPHFSLMPSGILRIDANIPPGNLLVFDFFRISPYSEYLVWAKIKGEILLEGIQTSLSMNVDTGGFLLWSDNLKCSFPLGCTLNGETVLQDQMYDVFSTTYLLKGLEYNLGIFKVDGDRVIRVDSPTLKNSRVQIQSCFIHYFKELNGT